MKRLLVWAPPLSLLFACSGSAVSLQPGQWETSLQFTSVEMPGAPEAQVAALRQSLATPPRSECMTQEQAANPGNHMLAHGAVCQFSENNFSGGFISVHAVCQQTPAPSVRMDLDGTYTATSIEARMVSEITAPPGRPGPQSVRMVGTMTSHRTGDCAR